MNYTEDDICAYLDAHSIDKTKFYLEKFDAEYAICYKSQTGDVYLSIDDKGFHSAVVEYLLKYGVEITILK